MIDATTYLSDGPIEHLRQGWAVMPFVGERAHYWMEDTETMPPQIRDGGRVRYYTARCGLTAMTDVSAPALGPGTFPKCKRCQRGKR